MPDNKQAPLLERADEPGIPTVPKEAQRDIQILERQFAEAEIKTCTLMTSRPCSMHEGWPLIGLCI